MKKFIGIFALATIMLFAFNKANAQTTVFLGKGDVQSALGLNNAGLNALVAAYNLELNDGDDQPLPIIFTYGSTETWELTITWITGGEKKEKIHSVTRERTYTVEANVSFIIRSKLEQVTGFWLTFSEVSSSSVPAIGSAYTNPGDNELGNDAIVSARSLISSTGGDGLRVNGVLIPDFVLPE